VSNSVTIDTIFCHSFPFMSHFGGFEARADNLQPSIMIDDIRRVQKTLDTFGLKGAHKSRNHRKSRDAQVMRRMS
jgi:hypothetical protein